MAVPNEHTFPHLATLGDCSIKTALRWLKTKHWIGKYIGMHPGMSLALATFTNHSPKLPYLSNCITWVKIFFWKHRVNFVHYVLLPTEQAETYLKIYYLTHILRRVVKKNNGYFTVRLTVSVYPPPPRCFWSKNTVLSPFVMSKNFPMVRTKGASPLSLPITVSLTAKIPFFDDSP